MFFHMDNHKSYRIIKIDDYSFLACLATMVLMIVLTIWIAGRYAFPTTEFQKKLSYAPAQTAVALEETKPLPLPKAPETAVLRTVEEMPNEPLVSGQGAAKTFMAERETAFKQGIAAESLSKPESTAVEQITPQKAAPGAGKDHAVTKTAAGTQNFLITIRGGRHKSHASIVFEFTGKADYEKPQQTGSQIRFKLKDVQTELRTYRKYKTFDSWVRLIPSVRDVDIEIGIPAQMHRFSAFSMSAPDRIVFNLYDQKGAAGKQKQQTPHQPAVTQAQTESTPDKSIVLKTIRGGRHTQYASIVFEFNARADSEKPRVDDKEIRFLLKKVSTVLRNYRRYKTFDSWVRLKKVGSDLAVNLGVPDHFVKLSAFWMTDPDRYVMNLYDRGTTE